MDITLECVPTTIAQNENHSHYTLLEQTNSTAVLSSLVSESAGVSNTRLKLKIDEIRIPRESWKEEMELATGEKTIIADLDWVRLEGTANPHQWRSLIMLLFPARDENFWVNKETNIKSYPSDPGYQNCAVGEYGTKLAWRREGDTWIWALTLPGTALKQMGTLSWARLFIAILEMCPTVNPTRLDACIEDHEGRLKPDEISQALWQRNYAGFRKKTMIISDSDGDGWDGFTFNLGSRESDSYWRIYHTGVKHGYNAVRLERELKGEKVKSAWFMLKTLLGQIKENLTEDTQNAESEIARLIAAIAIEGLRFVDCSNRYGNQSLENCPNLPWWERFVTLFDKVIISVPKKVISLKKSYDWLQRQVSKTLRKLNDGLGVSRFLDVMQNLVINVTKLDDRDKMQIAILRERGIGALTEKTIEDTSELALHKKWEQDWKDYLASMGMPIRDLSQKAHYIGI